MNAMVAPGDGPAISVDDVAELFEHFDRYSDVFLAVSGGPDSVALMHLAAAWQAHCRPACRLIVLTVDHGLRPEAATEAKAVAAAACALGLPAEILTWSGPRPDSKVQETAREIRYGLLLGRAGQAGPHAAIATGHHRDDLAETVLMRLARGASVDGLSAMRPVTHRGGVDVVRPLLGLPKARLLDILTATGAVWFDDPSNQCLDFERVRLRAARAARAELDLTDAALALTAERAARARAALEGLADQHLQPCLHSPALLTCGVFEWPWAPAAIPDETAVRLLMRVLPVVGGAVERVRLLRVERLWRSMQRAGFAGATLGNCVIARGRATPWLIYREPARRILPRTDLSVAAPLIWDNRFAIKVAPGAELSGLHVRAFERGDVRTLKCEAALTSLRCPLAALDATPVIEDAAGLLSIPALGKHRDPIKAAHLSCQFVVDRLVGQFGHEQ